MNIDKLSRWITSTLLTLCLAACNLPGSEAVEAVSGPQSWVDAPLDGMQLPLATYDIVAHAGDPGGISQIEFAVNGSVIGTVSGSGGLFTAHQAWVPNAPGEYLIRVRGMNSGGVWSEPAEVRVFVLGADATATLEPTPAVTATPTITATPSTPTLVLIQNANCRIGPGQLYQVLTSVLEGDSLPILGRNEDGTWWLVQLPSGERCWISAVTGVTLGDIPSVPAVEAPLLLGCYVYDPNLQPICTLPCPEDADPGGECEP